MTDQKSRDGSRGGGEGCPPPTNMKIDAYYIVDLYDACYYDMRILRSTDDNRIIPPTKIFWGNPCRKATKPNILFKRQMGHSMSNYPAWPFQFCLCLMPHQHLNGLCRSWPFQLWRNIFHVQIFEYLLRNSGKILIYFGKKLKKTFLIWLSWFYLLRHKNNFSARTTK